MAKKTNWEGAATAAPGSNNPVMGAVIDLATEAHDLAEVIGKHTEALSEATSRYNHIKTKELPEALASAGTSDWTSLDNRVHVELKDFVSGNLPKADDAEGEKKRKKAIDWVVKNGGEALIKTVITVSFEKKEHSKARALFSALKKQKYAVKMESGIHPQTFLAWIRERLRNGAKLDMEVLGITIGNYADISFPEGDVQKPKKRGSK